MVQARGGNDGRIDCRERPQELSNHLRNRIWKMKDPKSRVIMPSWACAHCGCLSPLYNVSQAETEWHFWLDWSMTRASWATCGKACEAAKMETRRASICCDQDSGQFCVRHLLVTVSVHSNWQWLRTLPPEGSHRKLTFWSSARPQRKQTSAGSVLALPDLISTD